MLRTASRGGSRVRNDPRYSVACCCSLRQDTGGTGLGPTSAHRRAVGCPRRRTYTTLTDLEAVFRSLKSELGLRPIHHRKPVRAEGHLFVTVVAYQAVQVIRRRLAAAGERASWTTLRDILAASSASPPPSGAPAQKAVYDALGIDPDPGGTRGTVVWTSPSPAAQGTCSALTAPPRPQAVDPARLQSRVGKLGLAHQHFGSRPETPRPRYAPHSSVPRHRQDSPVVRLRMAAHPQTVKYSPGGSAGVASTTPKAPPSPAGRHRAAIRYPTLR